MTTLITICAIIQGVLGQNNRRQQPRFQSVVAYAHMSPDESLVSLAMGASICGAKQVGRTSPFKKVGLMGR